jgi:hypothetical protein
MPRAMEAEQLPAARITGHFQDESGFQRSDYSGAARRLVLKRGVKYPGIVCEPDE